jgi:hypothetical protein
VVEYLYHPADYFESTFVRSSPDYELRFENGAARATLVIPVDPVPVSISDAVEAQVRALLGARQILVHRSFTIDGPRIEHHRADGSRQVLVFGAGEAIGLADVGRADFVVRDASGKVTDTKADRVAEHERFLSLIASAEAKHPLVAKLRGSYGAAVANPQTELVHLYEIRDALQTHFKGAYKAKRRLGITPDDWKRLGKLADRMPLEEGRHRGWHLSGLRPATPAELAEARAIARRMIEAFARSV